MTISFREKCVALGTLSVSAFLLPLFARAQLVMPPNPGLSTATSAEEVVIRIALFLTAIIGTLAVVVIVVAGIMYMTSAGDENRAAAAKRALTYAVVGLFVALVAWVIVNAVSNALGAGEGGFLDSILDGIFDIIFGP